MPMPMPIPNSKSNSKTRGPNSNYKHVEEHSLVRCANALIRQITTEQEKNEMMTLSCLDDLAPSAAAAALVSVGFAGSVGLIRSGLIIAWVGTVVIDYHGIAALNDIDSVSICFGCAVLMVVAVRGAAGAA
ncbi:hypothetical protein QBC44DRAFT_326957 [Cladorrhinum sp. PSN332]|nr:hypothetical protein QBC44DRAFT_326957 [Cladorrhinum sp. PSN332]